MINGLQYWWGNQWVMSFAVGQIITPFPSSFLTSLSPSPLMMMLRSFVRSSRKRGGKWDEELEEEEALSAIGYTGDEGTDGLRLQGGTGGSILHLKGKGVIRSFRRQRTIG